MTEIGGLIKAVGDLREVTTTLLERVGQIEDRLADLSGVPLTADQQARRHQAEDAAQLVGDALRHLDGGHAAGHGGGRDVLNVVREKPSARARPSTDLVARVNQALEHLGAQGGYVEQLRRLETKMDKQAQDIQTFETIVTELATAVSHALKQQTDVATKRDLLDTRGMLMVALDSLKQTILMRAETMDVTEIRKDRRWPIAVVGLSAAGLAAAVLVAIFVRGGI